MPELPEVETLCRQLKKKIVGRKIVSTEIYDLKLSGAPEVKSAAVVGVRRRGKTIVIDLDDDKSILIHLRMTGRLLWQDDGGRPKHSRWRADFGGSYLFLIDPRRFATMKVEGRPEERIENDIIEGFNEEAFMEKQARRKVKVKTLLMDPHAIAGIGNIYACEILYRAMVSPRRIALTVKRHEWRNIFVQAEKILKTAIKKRGSSISDWRDLHGRKGENQNELKVYGREGKSCSICGMVIKRMKQGGRSTFYCPVCQKQQVR